MRSSCLLLGFCVAAGVACARPTLEEMVVDAGREPMVSPSSEAGTPPSHDATVVEDKDANTSGTGDARTPPPRDAGDVTPAADASTSSDDAGGTHPMEAACKSAAAPTFSKDLGAATVRSLKVAGADYYSVVAPGSTVSVALNVTVDSCGIGGGGIVYSGLEGQGLHCSSPYFCTVTSLPSVPTEYSFRAPTAPGLYYIQGAAVSATTSTLPTCSGNPDNPANIGAICVSD